jgi:hypothetical protein
MRIKNAYRSTSSLASTRPRLQATGVPHPGRTRELRRRITLRHAIRRTIARVDGKRVTRDVTRNPLQRRKSIADEESDIRCRFSRSRRASRDVRSDCGSARVRVAVTQRQNVGEPEKCRFLQRRV